MNLPEDPQARNKILAGIGVAALAVVVGLFFGAKTWYGSVSELRTNIEDLKHKRDKAAEFQKKIPGLKDAHWDRRVDLTAKANSQQILQPYIPDSPTYLERGRRIIKAAEQNNRTLVTTVVEDGGPREFDAFYAKSKTSDKVIKPEDRTYQTYALRINAQADFANIAALLDNLESDNPYLTVTSIFIAPNEGNPTNHTVTASLEWPIFKDQKKVKKWLLEEGQTQPEANADESPSSDAANASPPNSGG